MTAFAGIRHGFCRMVSRASFQPPSRHARGWWRASIVGTLFTILLFPQAYASQPQAPVAQNDVQQAENSSTNLQEAETLLQKGRLDEAKIKIQAELQQNPSSIEGYNLLGFLYSEEKDYANAVDAFQDALKIAPNSTKTHNNLGNAYLAQGKLDMGEKEFRTVLRLDPRNRDGNYNLGLLLMSRGSPAEAIQYFEHVRPANLPTHFNLIRAYFQSKRTAEALRMATELSAENKNDVQLHFTLGVLLASEKQYKPAQFELEKADALQPGTFEILYNLGHTCLRSGENAEAEIALSRALKLEPESVETLSLLARVYANESRPFDALDLLIRAHKIAPENVDVILLMARVSMSRNYYEDAIPLLETGLKIASQRADLRSTLAESYFFSGRFDNAIDELKKLIAIEPSSHDYLFLGLSYEQLGRFDEANQYFQEGLKLDPNDNSCMFNLGYIAERQGDDKRAEAIFQQILRSNPDYPDALLELANLRIAEKRFQEAEVLLRRYVRVSRSPATGYYKLAMVERTQRETTAADQDLNTFQTLSESFTGQHAYEHLYDYVDNRSKLAPQARGQQDIAELRGEIQKHPDQPEDLYLLAEAYLKSGKAAEARDTITQLDKVSAGDYRTQTGVGVLLARYRLYDDAIQHFRNALETNLNSDEVKFDIANAFFRKGLYSEALDAAEQVSEAGRKDDAYLDLLGDIYAHLGNTARASEIFRDAINRNPDNDQDYLSLSLLQFRENAITSAKQTLLRGQSRIPGSGKILWGLGIVSVLEGNTVEAAAQLERAVDLLPEWPGSYATLGVFYFQTGQIAKAKEVLNRFRNSDTSGGLDVNRIEQVLEQAPERSSTGNEPLPMANRQQLLQLALSLADRTL